MPMLGYRLLNWFLIWPSYQRHALFFKSSALKKPFSHEAVTWSYQRTAWSETALEDVSF